MVRKGNKYNADHLTVFAMRTLGNDKSFTQIIVVDSTLRYRSDYERPKTPYFRDDIMNTVMPFNPKKKHFRLSKATQTTNRLFSMAKGK